MGLATLKEHSRHLLSVIQAGAEDDGLAELFETRAQLLRECQASLASGGWAGADEDLQEIVAIDGAIRDALIERRDAVCRELALLREGRSAAAAYRVGGPGSHVVQARYMDRAG
jgi:hypothetical protein